MKSEQPESWTIRRVVGFCAQDFAQRGNASARLDADLIVGHVLGLTRVALYMDLDRVLEAEELAAIRALVQRRRRHEPIAYLVGQREFWGRPFQVNAAVLIPRPDTETLVERALELLGPAPRRPRVSDAVYQRIEAQLLADAALAGEESGGVTAREGEAIPTPEAYPEQHKRPRQVLDLCTGTGCIGITLALERDVEVTLADISEEALEVARANVLRLAKDKPVTVVQADLFRGIAAARFDLIVANPPYLADAEMAEIDPDVRDHEPRLALVGGTRGTEVLSRLIAEVPQRLAPGGHVLLEMGPTQGAVLADQLRLAGLVEVKIHRDLGGRERVVEGRSAEVS